MKKIINKVNLLLFRNREELSLENKLSNILMFIGALICFFGFTINFFNNFPFILNCLIGICGIAYTILFYLSSFKKITKPLEIPFQLVTVFIILYNWFTLQGIEGSTSNFFYIGIFALIYCNSKKNYWRTFIFILLISAILVLIQKFFPSLIIPYPDKQTQLTDLWAGFILAILSFGLLTILVKKSFDKERIKTAEKTKELLESEFKYQFIVENTDDILWIMNGDLKIEYETESVYKFLGYTVEEHMQLSIDDYMTSEYAKEIKEEFQQGMINLMKKDYDKLRNKFEIEVDLVRKDKKIVNARITMMMIRDNQYRIVKIRGITTDITERKKAEKELLFAKQRAEESDRLKSAFLANMSHEIRTPMNGILGFTELLKNQDISNEIQKSYIEIIEQSGQRLLNTLNDIVDLSKIESGQFIIHNQNVYINKVLTELYFFFKPEASKKGLEFACCSEPTESDYYIKTDLTKLNQILTNLINNSLKFTETGSIIFGYKLNEHFIEFFVKDTGIGISSENQEIIFERFRQGHESITRNFEGSGLGLSISKGFVELLGGKIWLQSEVNRGTTFYFTIPIN